MLRWIKELRAREERQAAEERRRLADRSGQSCGSSHASSAEVQELESSSSDDDGAPLQKRSRQGFEQIPESKMLRNTRADVGVECTGKHRCPFDLIPIS